MITIGILTKPAFPRIKPVLQALIAWLQEREKQVILSPHTATMLGSPLLHQEDHLASLTDLIVVLGGDGTILRAARLVEESSTPILGVNMGELGFLTETTVEHMYTSLDNVFDHAFHLDKRLRLFAQIVRQGLPVEEATALNDIVISKGPLARMIRVQIKVNSKFVTNLRGDGIIVSTPTGSTAYSLSAGGPILEPSLDTILITPISPHTLTHRPFIIPKQVSLETVLINQEGAMVTFDGQMGIEVQAGDTVTISASQHQTHLIRFPDRTYFDVLRNKLNWGDG
ncbi:MAG: NAD(+) kinase [Nitrospirales bacterium]|nr:NAD(+) kinase [Nitrospirales bacterium]